VTTRNKLAFGAALWFGPFLLGIVQVSLATNRRERPAEEQTKKSEGKAPERLEIRGIENTFRLSPRLYSGGDPRGAQALTALKELGVRTIISVDGAIPDVEAARKLGLRYVHLPIGYDGVPREQAVRIVKAVNTLPGPVYVHCHHGMHRGPTVAAICGLATEGWSKDRALAWMKEAGTSPNYQGLYTSAREFVPPSAKELERVGKELPERTRPPVLVEMMIQVDERLDRMKAVQKAGFKAPFNHPDIDPPHEALQLLEQFRELVRLPEVKERGIAFLAAVEAAEKQVTSLEGSLRSLGKEPTAEARRSVGSAFLAVGKCCTACHAQYRDKLSPEHKGRSSDAGQGVEWLSPRWQPRYHAQKRAGHFDG
jgi:protein tyrosine phosphatase (PTP) superfamily phosphohydrolase (DUF442 family)